MTFLLWILVFVFVWLVRSVVVLTLVFSLMSSSLAGRLKMADENGDL